MKEIYYLVEVIGDSEFNIYSGTKRECENEMILQQENYKKLNRDCRMYVSCNRFS